MNDIVLITRPEQSALETAYAINAMGLQTFCEPLMEVVLHDVDLPNLDQYSALIFTSANAVQAFTLKSERRDMMAYCVGDNSLRAVRQAGFIHYKSAQGTVSDLINMLEKADVDGEMLYLRARDIAHPLMVKGKGIEEVTLYHTEKSGEISQSCLDLIKAGAFSYVLFYSLKTAETFVSLANKNGVKDAFKQCQALCLGDSMVECITNMQWKHVAVAATPDRAGMLHLLETLTGEI